MALHIASHQGHLEVVKVLVQLGAELNTYDRVRINNSLQPISRFLLLCSPVLSAIMSDYHVFYRKTTNINNIN
jgi:ankyrin repeat protein